MTGTSWWQTPYEHLAVESREASGRRVAVVRFDLPERRNAMSGPMTASWVRLMTALRGDPDLAAVVVTGNGRAFNAGGDLSWIVSEPDASVPELRQRMLAFYRDWLSIRALEVPTIAAVNGAAIGAGLAVALACDIRYVATTARMGVPFTSLGLHPGMATTWSLPQVAGLAVARDLLLTGRIVDGQEAVALGLASRARAAGVGAGRGARRGRPGGGRGAGRDPAHDGRAARRRARHGGGGPAAGRAWPRRLP